MTRHRSKLLFLGLSLVLVALANVVTGEDEVNRDSGSQAASAPQSDVAITDASGDAYRNDRGEGRRDYGGNDNREERSRNSDSRGGYVWGNRYWWRGGYWEGGCYGCGIWRSETAGYPTCPTCQYYDPDQRLCITVRDCPNN